MGTQHVTHKCACCSRKGLGVALDIAMGLHCFHCNGVIHCDIKWAACRCKILAIPNASHSGRVLVTSKMINKLALPA